MGESGDDGAGKGRLGFAERNATTCPRRVAAVESSLKPQTLTSRLCHYTPVLHWQLYFVNTAAR